MSHRSLAAVVFALSACAIEHTESVTVDDAAQLAMIRHEAYYSAFDGVREYRIAPAVSELAMREDAADPVQEDSLVWKVDPAFATQEPYNKLPGAVLLTMRGAGTTRIEARATTASGRQVKDSVPLEITAATDEQFAMGVDAFRAQLPLGPKAAPERMTVDRCGVQISTDSSSMRCIDCHQRSSAASDPEAPRFEHAWYSDRKLIDMFTNGGIPADYEFSSPFLRTAGLRGARCIFDLHHSACVPDEVAMGLVFRLRSFPPP
jgi:hypothetical protein